VEVDTLSAAFTVSNTGTRNGNRTAANGNALRVTASRHLVGAELATEMTPPGMLREEPAS